MDCLSESKFLCRFPPQSSDYLLLQSFASSTMRAGLRNRQKSTNRADFIFCACPWPQGTTSPVSNAVIHKRFFTAVILQGNWKIKGTCLLYRSEVTELQNTWRYFYIFGHFFCVHFFCVVWYNTTRGQSGKALLAQPFSSAPAARTGKHGIISYRIKQRIGTSAINRRRERRCPKVFYSQGQLFSNY